MKPAWQLPQTIGPSYLEVIKKYPDKYELRGGDVWYKKTESWVKIATKRFPGRPLTKQSLIIKHDFNNLEKLGASCELAKIFDEHGCSDFIERPHRQSVKVISEIIKNRF